MVQWYIYSSSVIISINSSGQNSSSLLRKRLTHWLTFISPKLCLLILTFNGFHSTFYGEYRSCYYFSPLTSESSGNWKEKWDKVLSVKGAEHQQQQSHSLLHSVTQPAQLYCWADVCKHDSKQHAIWDWIPKFTATYLYRLVIVYIDCF